MRRSPCWGTCVGTEAVRDKAPSGRHACGQAITARQCRRCRRRRRRLLAISVMISQHYGRVVLAGVKRRHQAGRQHMCRFTGSYTAQAVACSTHACSADASPASGLLRVHCNMLSSVAAPRGEACSRLTRPREHMPRLCSSAAGLLRAVDCMEPSSASSAWLLFCRPGLGGAWQSKRMRSHAPRRCYCSARAR